MTPAEAKRLAESTLSAERFYHTCCVADAARELAKRYGLDAEKAELAAFLHDILKERPHADLLQILGGSAIMDGELSNVYPPLLHAYAGGVYVERELGLGRDIADAVRYHTAGRADMTPLEKAVFLADYISADRAFRGAEEVRDMAFRSMDAACLAALRNSLTHLLKLGRCIDLNSIRAFNHFVELERQNNNGEQ